MAHFFYKGVLAILLVLLVILLSFHLRGRPAEECVSFRQTVTGDGPFHFSQRIRNSLYDMEIDCKGELILSDIRLRTEMFHPIPAGRQLSESGIQG